MPTPHHSSAVVCKALSQLGANLRDSRRRPLLTNDPKSDFPHYDFIRICMKNVDIDAVVRTYP